MRKKRKKKDSKLNELFSIMNNVYMKKTKAMLTHAAGVSVIDDGTLWRKSLEKKEGRKGVVEEVGYRDALAFLN